jgi:hypothetical protein
MAAMMTTPWRLKMKIANEYDIAINFVVLT